MVVYRLERDGHFISAFSTVKKAITVANYINSANGDLGLYWKVLDNVHRISNSPDGHTYIIYYTPVI